MSNIYSNSCHHSHLVHQLQVDEELSCLKARTTAANQDVCLNRRIRSWFRLANRSLNNIIHAAMDLTRDDKFAKFIQPVFA